MFVVLFIPINFHFSSVSFAFYDLDRDGKISPSELLQILKESLYHTTKSFTEEQMMQAVDATFKEVDLDQDGFISLDEFREMVIRHPLVIGSLTISNDFCLS